jgi:hypothetical protein
MKKEIQKTYEVIVEKNVPVPPKKPSKWSGTEDMEIGDSVLVPSHVDSISLQSYCRRKGVRCTSRKVEGGYRVWRIE